MKKSIVLPPFLVLAATFIAFLPCLNFGFLYWDDVKNVVTNPYIRHLDRASLGWMWTTHFQGPYQPLSWMSWAVDFKLWGLRPFGFHLTNLLLHGANAILVYFLLGRYFKASRWAAAAGALLFAIHPLRVESVVWVTERRDVLSGFFFLLAVWAYLSRRIPWSLLAFALALCSKATTVGLVWVLIALDLMVLQRLPLSISRWKEASYRAVWEEKIPYLGLAFIMGVLNLLVIHAQGILQSRYSALDRMVLFLANASFYLQKIIWPHPLLPYYELPVHLASISGFLGFYTLATLALTGLIWRLRTKVPGLGVVWGTYLLILIPMSGIAQNGQQMAADRYTYLAALPWAAALTGLLVWRPRLAAIVVPVLGIFLVLTRWQTSVWANDETLWRYTLRFAPGTYLAHSNLGTLYLRQGRDGESVRELREAILLRPTDVEGRLNLGVLEERQSHFVEAERLYKEALHLAPGNGQVQNNVALVRARQGYFAEAIQDLREVVAANPNFAEAQLNLGVLLMHEGFSSEGQQCIGRAIAIKPELAARLRRSNP